MNKFNNNFEKNNNYIPVLSDNQKKEQAHDDNEPVPFIFEFMGLKIYLDDIILFSILFFLYKEDVEDNFLSTLLVLLLLS